MYLHIEETEKETKKALLRKAIGLINQAQDIALDSFRQERKMNAGIIATSVRGIQAICENDFGARASNSAEESENAKRMHIFNIINSEKRLVRLQREIEDLGDLKNAISAEIINLV